MFCISGDCIAVVEEDGPVTFIVNWPVAGFAFATFTLRGEQDTPGNDPQVIATAPVNPFRGVTVIVDGPLLPAVTVACVPLTVNVTLVVTVTVTPAEVDVV
jgi:hypothetical protein